MIKIYAKQVWLLITIYYFIFFGIAYLLSSNILDSTIFIISYLPISIVIAYLSRSNIILYKKNLIDLEKTLYILSIFILFLTLLLLINPPIFSSNPNIDRVIFREPFYVKSLLLPMQFVASLILSLLMIYNFKRIYLFLFFIIILNGFLSGFRTATIVPILNYVLLVFVTSKGSFYFIKRNLLVIFMIVIIFILIVITTYFRFEDTPLIDIITKVLFKRILFENYDLNHLRYNLYYDNYGPQLGYTYIMDFLSVLRIEEHSFQQLLSGGGILTMNTPYYSELFVNFGEYSFVFSFFVAFLFAIITYLIIIILPKNEKLLFKVYLSISVAPSILQAGITKYLFVTFPKTIFIFMLLYFIRRIIYAKKNKCDINNIK